METSQQWFRSKVLFPNHREISRQGDTGLTRDVRIPGYVVSACLCIWNSVRVMEGQFSNT